MANKHWSKEETDFLIENCQKMSVMDISRKMERNPESIKLKIKNLGLLKKNISSFNCKKFISNPVGKERFGIKRKGVAVEASNNLVPLKIDSRTIIYIKSGENAEEAKSKYLKNRL